MTESDGIISAPGGVLVVQIKGDKVLTPSCYVRDIDPGTRPHIYYPDANGKLVVEDEIDSISGFRFYSSNKVNFLGEINVKGNIRELVIKSSRPLTIQQEAFYENIDIEKVHISCPERIYLQNDCFCSCENLKEVEIVCNDGTFKEVKLCDLAFASNDTLESIKIGKTATMSIGDSSFFDCEKLKRISFDTKAADISSKAFYGCNSIEEFHIPVIDLNQLVSMEKYDNLLVDELRIDDMSGVSIACLNKILSDYPKSAFNKVTMGKFTINIDELNAPVDLKNLICSIEAPSEVVWIIKNYANTHRYELDALNKIHDYFDPIAIEENVVFLKNIIPSLFNDIWSKASLGSQIFIQSPALMEKSFNTVLNNIQLLRKNTSVTDDDIKLCYFKDYDFSIDLDNEEDIKKYLMDYVVKHNKLPGAINSLFCDSTDENIIDIIDRINYVTTMNLSEMSRDAFLCKDSVEIIKSIDDQSFNRMFDDYTAKASIYNEKIPGIKGIKTVMYNKLKGYINQDLDENILFDQLFEPIVNDINDSYVKTNMIDYINSIDRFLPNVNKDNMEHKKNAICGKILYTVLSGLKHVDGKAITEENVKEFLSNFKSSDYYKKFGYNIYNDPGRAELDSDCIEMSLKIDPYSFDMLRNYSNTSDISIKAQLDDALIRGPVEKSLFLRTKASRLRFLTNNKLYSNYIEPIIGHEDVRYYRIAKANGYRFTKEEDEEYERKIEEFNRELDEVINDPKYSDPKYSVFKEELEKYRIQEVNTKPDIMTVFYEYLQNQIIPANIPYDKKHEFEDRVRELVDNYIDKGSKDESELSKIIYSVDMLYRNNNPSILFKSTEEIIENPKLINNPSISDVEKIGIALVALNKMAHEQVEDFIPSEYITRYRFNSSDIMSENKAFAKSVVDSLTILGNYQDIEEAYNRLFNKDGELKKNTDFYKYVDIVDEKNSYEKMILVDLDSTAANEIFNIFEDNKEVFEKLYNKKSINTIDPSIKELYSKYKKYMEYLFKYYKEDGVNPLLLSDDDKKNVKEQFEHYKEHIDDDREKNEKGDYIDGNYTDEDYLKYFRCLRKTREAIKEKPEVVKHLVDNAISQRNMYDLKQQFAEILMDKIIKALSDDNKDSKKAINEIINFTKEDKINMFKNRGIIIEIQEDVTTPDKDVLVIYSKNVREPYSVHLINKVINDSNREFNTTNNVIVNGQLDNKNLTLVDKDYTYDFTGKEIDFTKEFKKQDLGRANAILLNFLNVEIPSLLQKHNISREELRNVLVNNKETDNTIIKGIIKMINNLNSSGTLAIPKDLELDEESKYLKGFKFNNINRKYIPTIVGIIGKDYIKYSNSCSEGFTYMMNKYNEILKNPSNKNYYDTLRKVMTDLSFEKTDPDEKKYYNIGDEFITYELTSNKAYSELNKLNKKIDMLKSDDKFRNLVKIYICRVAINKISRTKSSEKIKVLDELVNQLKNSNSYIDESYCLEVSNLSDEEKKEIIDVLLEKRENLLGELSSKDASHELEEMFEKPKEITDDEFSKS